MSVTANLTTNVETITATIMVEDETIIAEINTAARGPAGADGGGTGSIDSTTTSDGTANLSLSNVTTATATITGMSVAPTAATTTSTTQLATTAFVQQELASGVAVAKNLEFLAHNGTGVTITKGAIVYINGAVSSNPRITLAQANNDTNSARTIGFAKADIANGANGFVIMEGELENVRTADADGIIGAGNQIYLSPTTPGAFTRTKPSAPNHLVYVGVVTRASTGANLDGRILVGIQNGYELNEIHDVAISSPAAKQVLKRNAGNTLWANEAIVSADVSDATSAATANTLVRRDGTGGASFVGLNTSTLDSSGITTTGQVEFNGTDAGDSLTFNMVNYFYGTGAASAHRIALGAGTTGATLFGAATAAEARTTLGITRKKRTATANKSSDTTFAADLQITAIPVVANTSYRARLVLFATLGAGGLKAKLSLPSIIAPASTASGRVGTRVFWGQSFATPITSDSASNSISLIATNDTASTNQYVGDFEFRVGATGGNAVFEWAQNSSNATNSSLLEGSYLELEEI
jgi:hypothetical protein